MRRPWPLLLALLTIPVAADAAETEPGFVRAALPSHLGPPPPARHTPSPFPDDEEIEFQGDGPNGWAILGGILGAGAVVSALVSASAHARLNSTDTPPSELRGLRQTRSGAGYTALALTGGSGLSLVIAVVR